MQLRAEYVQDRGGDGPVLSWRGALRGRAVPRPSLAFLKAAWGMLNRTCSHQPHEIVSRHYGKRCVERARPNATSAPHSGKTTAADYTPSATAAAARRVRLDEARYRPRHPA